MDIIIDKQLRELRHKRGNTQEELANFLNISFQAVSKWERGESLPDISLLPKIAAFYNVSVDELLGVGEIRKQEKIHEYCVKGVELLRSGKTDECIAMWREAYAEFPHDMEVNVELMFALYHKRDEKCHDEALALGEKILRDSTDERQRGTTIQLLCRIYYEKGNEEKAEEYALMASGIETSRNVLLSLILKGEQYIAQNYEVLLDCLDIIQGAESRLSEKADDERTIQLKEFYIKILELYFDDGYYGYFSLYAIEHHYTLAKLYLSLRSDEQKAHEHLKKAVKYAKQYDNLPDPPTSTVYTSTLMNGVQSNHAIFGSYPETECEMLLNSLNNSEFDIVRDKDWFKEIEQELRENIGK